MEKPTTMEKPTKTKRVRKKQEPLQPIYHEDMSKMEIGIDEAGRGPLFGRVYSAGVLLPTPNQSINEQGDTFDYSCLKDSKKFTSKKKLMEVAEYIKRNAIAWNVTYEDETTIDKINILQATLQCMHRSIRGVIDKVENSYQDNHQDNHQTGDYYLLVDGTQFKPFIKFNIETGMYQQVPYTCIKGGDNSYCSIAAASILAKVERDTYIELLCQENDDLNEKYGISNNKGYGTKQHLEGIKKHGISKWHRKTYGICREYC